MTWVPGAVSGYSPTKKKRHRSAFFVVFAGRETGVFSTWDDCMRSVANVARAKFEGFNSLEEAEKAFSLQL